MIHSLTFTCSYRSYLMCMFEYQIKFSNSKIPICTTPSYTNENNWLWLPRVNTAEKGNLINWQHGNSFDIKFPMELSCTEKSWWSRKNFHSQLLLFLFHNFQFNSFSVSHHNHNHIHHIHIIDIYVHRMRNHMGNEAKSLLLLWNEIQYQNCARSEVNSPHIFPCSLTIPPHTSPRVNLIRFYNWLLFEMNLFSSHIIISHVVPCHESEPSASVWGGKLCWKIENSCAAEDSFQLSIQLSKWLFCDMIYMFSEEI